MDILTKQQRKMLNSASKNLRNEGKDLHNADEKRKRAKKEIDIVLKDTIENANLSKIRRQEIVGSDECVEVSKSPPD